MSREEQEQWLENHGFDIWEGNRTTTITDPRGHEYRAADFDRAFWYAKSGYEAAEEYLQMKRRYPWLNE